MSEEKLERSLGRYDMTAIVINTIIGAGIFGLPAKVFAQIGSYSLLAFILCAVIVGLVVFCYAEVASRFSATGGPYLYAKEAFGSAVGFEVGWLYWVVRVATFAANCNLLVTYLGVFVPGANEGYLRVLFVTLIVAIIAVVNLIGIRESATVTNIFTFGKLLPLVIFVAIGAFFVSPANFTFDIVPEYSAFSSAVLLLIYAFVGFEASVVIAGETKDPGRSVPFGLIAGIGIVTVLYIAIQIVAIGTLPGLAASERPIADAAASFLGPFGAAFITVGVLLSIFGNLNVGVLSSTRLLFAMAEQRDLPSALDKTHSRFKTPYVSIILTSVVILVLTIQSSFLTAVAMATITRLLVYATTCVALPIFRRRADMPAAPFAVPFGVVASLLSIALIIWLLTNVDFAKEGLAILVAGAVGIVIFLANKYFGSRTENV
ncbi:MAG: amino acid permease [Pyrinomonadaceae bacterium]|nr:amino acid permease [Acidobacteriota bacterium]MBK7933826.1 amino acid permease [Acidobacteriota bacterium]MBP7377430.1 amino acid permease [Pyrinomonadaceae bacterium]